MNPRASSLPSWPAGTPATHPLTGRELRALRRLQRENGPSTHLFMSERKAPISTAGFQKMVERTSARAKLGFQAHAHMLRHACGYKLANDGVDTRRIQAYLGHRYIKHTVRCTEPEPGAFQGAVARLASSCLHFGGSANCLPSHARRGDGQRPRCTAPDVG